MIPVEKRRDPIKVPACDVCNGEKGALESYLATVLPFGAVHEDAVENLKRDVPKRLDGNKAVAREIRGSLGTDFWLQRDDDADNPPRITLDTEKLDRLYEFIVRGLVWHHRRISILPPYVVTGVFLPRIHEDKIPEVSRYPGERVSGNIADGAFIYEGVLSEIDEQVSAWKFQILGGLEFSNDEAPAETIGNIWRGASGKGKQTT